ncbi:MAG: hypothetical protein ACFCUL_11175 [Flavobacteriaceae bacterium]
MKKYFSATVASSDRATPFCCHYSVLQKIALLQEELKYMSI